MSRELAPPPAGAEAAAGLVTYLLNPGAPMSSGKTIAQVAHAAVMAAEEPALAAWVAAGCPGRVLAPTPAAFARAAPGRSRPASRTRGSPRCRRAPSRSSPSRPPGRFRSLPRWTPLSPASRTSARRACCRASTTSCWCAAWPATSCSGSTRGRSAPRTRSSCGRPAATRWHRCLRCDSWLPIPAPEQPPRRALPARDEVELPLRGRPLRDKIVLRLIAIDRALHFFVLGLLGVLILLFSSSRDTFRARFFQVVADLQGGAVSGNGGAKTGLLGEIDKAFSLQSTRLHLFAAVILAYALVEGIEAVGLWYQRRWAEYLTFLVTASLLPLEIYELTNTPVPVQDRRLRHQRRRRRLPAGRQAPVRAAGRGGGRRGDPRGRRRLARAGAHRPRLT